MNPYDVQLYVDNKGEVRGSIKLFEAIMGVVIGCLTVFLAEMRRKRKISLAPPPTGPNCEKCFFLKEFKNKITQDITKRLKND